MLDVFLWLDVWFLFLQLDERLVDDSFGSYWCRGAFGLVVEDDIDGCYELRSGNMDVNRRASVIWIVWISDNEFRQWNRSSVSPMLGTSGVDPDGCCS